MLTRFVLGQNPLGFHRMAYTEWGATGDEVPVICVHGLARNGRDFDRLAAALAAERRVICPDIVGRGASDNLPDPTLYTYAQYCADMTALIARIDAPQVDWVGTSMGGVIGMMLAAQPNSPIRRLIINDIGPFIPLAAIRRIGDYVGRTTAFDSVEQLERHLRVIYASFGITRDEDWRDFAVHSQRALPNGQITKAYDIGIAHNFSAAQADVDLWAVYDRVRCPTLVLRGAQSDVLPAEIAEEMTRRGPCAELVEIPDVGHAPALLETVQISYIQRFLFGK